MGYITGKTEGSTNQVGTGVAPYSGQLTPGAQPLQSGEWSMENQMLQGNAPGQAQATAVDTSLAKPWDPTEATQEWTKAIQDPAMQNWNQNLLPSILEKYAGADAAGGGNAAKTVTDQAMQLQTGLESNLASTLLSDKSTSNSQALGASQDIYSHLQQILSGASGGGSEQYNVGQAQDTALQKNWETAQPYNNPWLSLGTGGENVTAMQNIVTPNQSILPAAISAGASVAPSLISTVAPMLAGCCFIFIAANDGVLHPIVRRYRDEHMTEQNRRGYYKLSDWLVPKMKKHKLVYHAVRFLMTEPMTSYGKWFYGASTRGEKFRPLAKFWLKVFDWMGRGKRYVRSNGEVI